MSRKAQPLLAINLPPPITAGGTQDTGAVDDVAPPAQPTIDAPINLSLSSSIVYSSAAPQAAIDATWDSVGQATPSYYVIQVSLSSSFTASGTITTQAIGASAHIEGLTPGTLYYVRVKAVAGRLGGDWSDTESITTDTDTVPAGVPTSVTATWIGIGDLLIVWTNPTEANLKDVQVVIRASSGGTVLRTAYSATGRVLYTLAMNLADTAGVGDSSLYTELTSRTFSNVFGTTVNTGLVTKAVPATPASLTHTWSGDTNNNGLAGASWTLKWTRANDAARYHLTLDGVARSVSGNADSYDYPLALNISEHSGTPDPILDYSLVAVDGFGQSSAAASGTATNEEPPTTAIAIAAGFSALAASATPSTVADFRDYTFRVILGGVTQATYRSTSPDQTYKATVAGSYTVGVKVNDLFGQASTETISSAVVLDALTIEELRSELSYTSDDGQTQANLNKLKDGDLATGATSHALSAVAWLTITASRALIDRYGQITFVPGAISGGALKVYFGLSLDGVTFTWHAGPLGATGGTGQNTTLLAYGLEANAQTNALTVTAGTIYRFDVAALTEARYIVLKHRNTTAGYTLREFYPRRLLQTDDFQAESIMAINIGADQVLANHISVLSLSSIVADVGKLTITNPAGNAWIYQGTGTGDSPTTGLKIFNSGGIGKLSTYNATIEQVTLDTDGKLKAGGGAFILDASGMKLDLAVSTGPEITLAWDNGATAVAEVLGGINAGYNELLLGSYNSGGSALDAQIKIRSFLATPANSNIQFWIDGAQPGAIDKQGMYIEAINIGNVVTGTAAFGTIAMTAFDAATTTQAALLSLGHNTSGTPGVGFGIDIPFALETTTTPDTSAALIRTTWVTATHASRAARMRFFIYDTAARTVLDLEANGSAPMIGFLGAGAVARQALGAAAPAGGTGTAAGGYDTAANRNAAITLLNNIRSALITNGLCSA
jgi:hypothetical protein